MFVSTSIGSPYFQLRRCPHPTLSARPLGQPSNGSRSSSLSSIVLRSGPAWPSSSPAAARATTLGSRPEALYMPLGIWGNNNNNNHRVALTRLKTSSINRYLIKLQHLQELNLSGNNITRFPNCLHLVEKLGILRLHSNQIEKFPKQTSGNVLIVCCLYGE